MIPHRSTDGPTALDWLDIVQRGGTAEWCELYARCRDPEFARRVAEMLVFRDPDLMASARLWKFLLQDLHPGLAIDIREGTGARAV